MFYQSTDHRNDVKTMIYTKSMTLERRLFLAMADNPDFPNFEFVFSDDITDEELLESTEFSTETGSNIEIDCTKSCKGNDRFTELSKEELDSLVEKAQSPSTKTNTKWAVKLFEGWNSARNNPQKLHEMTNSELDCQLRRFYAEARAQDGKSYSRSSLLCLRNSIERYLNNPPFNRGVKFVKNPEFQQSNQMLNAKMKVQKQEGKENVVHKPVIERGDMVKLRSSPVLRGSTALGLLRNVWFHIVLYWCRRGVEGLRALKAESFEFRKDDEGKEFVTMTHDEATKNHPGGSSDVESFEKLGRMYKTAQDPFLDGVSCLKLYLSKRNPSCDAFFQYPKRKFVQSDEVWYDNKPLGINKLQTMMKDISSEAELSKLYTNHSVRATAITLWSDADVPSHIMSISGHRNEQSIKSYNSRPSAEKLRSCSEILTNALQTTDATEAPKRQNDK